MIGRAGQIVTRGLGGNPRSMMLITRGYGGVAGLVRRKVLEVVRFTARLAMAVGLEGRWRT